MAVEAVLLGNLLAKLLLLLELVEPDLVLELVELVLPMELVELFLPMELVELFLPLTELLEPESVVPVMAEVPLECELALPLVPVGPEGLWPKLFAALPDWLPLPLVSPPLPLPAVPVPVPLPPEPDEGGVLVPVGGAVVAGWLGGAVPIVTPT